MKKVFTIVRLMGLVIFFMITGDEETADVDNIPGHTANKNPLS